MERAGQQVTFTFIQGPKDVGLVLAYDSGPSRGNGGESGSGSGWGSGGERGQTKKRERERASPI